MSGVRARFGVGVRVGKRVGVRARFSVGAGFRVGGFSLARSPKFGVDVS